MHLLSETLLVRIVLGLQETSVKRVENKALRGFLLGCEDGGDTFIEVSIGFQWATQNYISS
jgi:hypothetical protein